MNGYFSSISDIFASNDSESLDGDITELANCVNNKMLSDIYFKIPTITPEQVSTFIMALDS